MRLLASLCLVFSAAVAAEPLYDFNASSVLTALDDFNFDAIVVKDDANLWVVEYYTDWCGHCKQFAKGYQKAAANLDGLVKFGAVNADESKKLAQVAGVQSYPSVKLYVPGTGGRNPYTGKSYKPAVDYSGPRTAKGIVEFATATLPSLIFPVTDNLFSKFKQNGTLPKALLFTQKPETAPLLKALSLKLSGRMMFGEVRETAEKTVAEIGVTEFPTLVVLSGDPGVAPIKYGGELKLVALMAFLEAHAAAEVVTQEMGGSGGKGGGAPTSDDLAMEITASTVKEQVEGERDAWVLVFSGTEIADLPPPGVSGLAEALYGQAKVGRASADIAENFGVKLGKEPTLVVWPFRKSGVKRKASKTFEPTEEGVAAAKKAALETLTDQNVEKLDQNNLQMFVQSSMASTDAKAVCLLFSDKASVPPLFRALSLSFEGKLGFGMAQATDPIAQNFNVRKAPTLLVMYPDDKQVDEKTGQVPLTGMQFTPQMHGKFNYANIATFLGGAIAIREQATLGRSSDGSSSRTDGDESGPSGRGASGSSLAGPIQELTADMLDEVCVSKGGLCAIAMLDGAPENANKEGHLEMLTKLKKRKAGGPLAFSWLDATCQPEFAGAFGLSEVDLPTMIFISPTKLKWARAVGAFDAETLGGFGSLVAAGRKATETLDAMPQLADVDCATVKRGADAYIEEDGADDIMAEILAEEARAREEREAAVAASIDGAGAAAAVSSAQKKKSEMSKLERLEADVEECEAMDLLCNARREKQLAAVKKERDLQEKLEQIKRKKAKAKKKAKKKAASA